MRVRVVKAISHLRVPFTYLMAALALILANKELFLPALVLVLMGMAIRVWAAGHLVKKRKLSKAGPYAYTRNPLYLGSLLTGTGTFLLIQNWWLLLAFLSGFALFYGSAIAAEEAYLSDRYGSEFAEYRRKVPILLPRLAPGHRLEQSAFHWNRTIENDEHIAVLASVLVIGFIFALAYLW